MSFSPTQVVGQSRSKSAASGGPLVSVAIAPAEHGCDVVAVVVLAGGFGLIAEGVLIDADVVGVSEVLFDDVVEIDARHRPLIGAVIFMGSRYSHSDDGCDPGN